MLHLVKVKALWDQMKHCVTLDIAGIQNIMYTVPKN